MAKKDKETLPILYNLFSGQLKRKGIFEQGRDKLGRRYEKKLDENNIYTKQEELKDGTMKYTIKDLRNKKNIIFRADNIRPYRLTAKG